MFTSEKSSFCWMALMLLLQSCDIFAFVNPAASMAGYQYTATSPGKMIIVKSLVEMQAQSRKDDVDDNVHRNKRPSRKKSKKSSRSSDITARPKHKKSKKNSRSFGQRKKSSNQTNNHPKSKNPISSNMSVQKALDKIDHLFQNENNCDKLNDAKSCLKNMLLRTINEDADECTHKELDSILEAKLQRMNKLEVIGLLNVLRDDEYQMLEKSPSGPIPEFSRRGDSPSNYRERDNYNQDNNGDNNDSIMNSRDSHQSNGDSYIKNSDYNNDSRQQTLFWWDDKPHKDDHYYGYELGNKYNNAYKNN
uniref:Brr2 N-terminal helicase PWI domain-containing protein n=1 Tax=Ditylum brightwellii TaxID=49249 RepID=A0A7S1ZKL4_9STRA|mmetsp:Transcript_339/g.510  ORF Transcript_339/g.510 Transcript_339/m.510 type:complete len:306 (+) Transcript_339:136-1053(+)